MSRVRITQRQAAMRKKADPYTMNQTRFDPGPTDYESGNPSSWAEDIHDENRWKSENEAGRVETGHPKFRKDTWEGKNKEKWGPEDTGPYDGGNTEEFRKSSSQRRFAQRMQAKADKAISLAEAFLGRKASTKAVHDQAIAFMDLPESSIVASLERAAMFGAFADGDVYVEEAEEFPMVADDEVEEILAEDAVMAEDIVEEAEEHCATCDTAFVSRQANYCVKCGAKRKKASEEAPVPEQVAEDEEEAPAEEAVEAKKAKAPVKAKKADEAPAEEAEDEEEAVEAKSSKKADEEEAPAEEAEEETPAEDEEEAVEAKTSKKADEDEAPAEEAEEETEAEDEEEVGSEDEEEAVEAKGKVAFGGIEIDAPEMDSDTVLTASDDLLDQIFGVTASEEEAPAEEAEEEAPAEEAEEEAPAEEVESKKAKSKKAKKGAKTLGGIDKKASGDEISSLSSLWKAEPKVNKVFGLPE